MNKTPINDGGPAFPFSSVSQNQATGETTISQGDGGMTLRDYMAVHSTQPGCAEICMCAGFGFDGFKVYLFADDKTGIRFDEWWRGLSLERMCELSAKVRYAQADAMLKARAA